MKKLFVEIAKGNIGTTEKGGNNRGAEIIEFQKATWLPPGAWSWCCAFVAWCLREVLTRPEGLVYFGFTPLAANKWRCKGANTADWLTWAKNHNLTLLTKADLAKQGDIVIFDFQADGKDDHIGIVAEDQLDLLHNIVTVEGNTNGAGSKDGDGVYLKNRKPSLVSHYIRM